MTGGRSCTCTRGWPIIYSTKRSSVATEGSCNIVITLDSTCKVGEETHDLAFLRNAIYKFCWHYWHFLFEVWRCNSIKYSVRLESFLAETKQLCALIETGTILFFCRENDLFYILWLYFIIYRCWPGHFGDSADMKSSFWIPGPNAEGN